MGLWGQKRGSQGTQLLGLQELDEGLGPRVWVLHVGGLEEDGSLGETVGGGIRSKE